MELRSWLSTSQCARLMSDIHNVGMADSLLGMAGCRAEHCSNASTCKPFLTQLGCAASSLKRRNTKRDWPHQGLSDC
eukprot:6808218-Alexandrium_andersonii.AAC.1